MKTGIKIVIVIVIVLAILGIGSCSVVVGVYNELTTQEKIVTAQYDQNKNNYDNYFKKVKEVVQVPEMYTNDFKKIYDSTMEKRYGDKGSQAMFQFIKEHNPNFDSSLYKQIQQVIEAGRNDFEQNQKMLIDKKRVYETILSTWPRNIIAMIFGFPKVDLSKIAIITSDITTEAFQTKKSEPLKLR